MLVLFMVLVWVIKMMIVYHFLVSFESYKDVDDELLSWVIMICDLKILSFFLLFLLSSMLIKFIVIMLMSKKSVMDEFWYVQ